MATTHPYLQRSPYRRLVLLLNPVSLTACAVVGLAVGYIAAVCQTPIFESTVVLRLPRGFEPNSHSANLQARVLGREVMAEARTILEASTDPPSISEELSESLRVELLDENRNLAVSARSESAHRAKQFAETISRTFLNHENESRETKRRMELRSMLDESIRDAVSKYSAEYRRVSLRPGERRRVAPPRLELMRELLASQEQLDRLTPARVERTQRSSRSQIVSPDTPAYAKVGASIGAAFGLLMNALVVFGAVGRRQFTRELADCGLEVLGIGPTSRRSTAELEEHNSEAAERIRRIRLAVTGSIPQQPRSLLVVDTERHRIARNTAIELAVSFAHAGQETLLIEANTRWSSLAEIFEVEEARGLASVLDGSCEFTDALVATDHERLSILPCPQPPGDPGDASEGTRFRKLLQDAGSRFDTIILTCAPAIRYADAATLCAQVGGVVVTSAAAPQRSGSLTTTVSELQRQNANMLGIVVAQRV